MNTYDLIIIGSGPGGYVAAIRAGQLGMKTAIVEKTNIGGMCLNWGCIPSKNMIWNARIFERITKASNYGIEGIDLNALSFNWKKAISGKDRIVMRLVKGVEFLLKKNKVEIIKGEAKLTGANTIRVGDTDYEAKKIIIATGSRPERKPIADVPSEMIVEMDDFFRRETIPEKFLVLGGTPTACEIASMLRYLGKKVAMVTQEKTLIPGMDSSVIKFVTEKFRKIGISVHFGKQITKHGDGGVYVGDEFVECDMILNCSERLAILPQIENVDLELTDGFIEVNEFMQSNVPNIYAIGDVTGTMCAHHASAQGSCAVNHIAGVETPIDYGKVPINIYLDPEIGSVGYTEEQLIEQGIAYKKGEFPVSVNGKAMAENNTEGFVKVLADEKYGEVLGVHIVSAHAIDMISEAVLAMQLEGTIEDIGRVVHAHPSMSETFLEADFAAMDKPLHM
jgi:dihydrolipoamide dehydrogenase